MTLSLRFQRIVASIITMSLLAGCEEEPGCQEDYFTPTVMLELVEQNTPESLLAASIFANWVFVQEKGPDIELPGEDELLLAALELAPTDQMVMTSAMSSCNPSRSTESSGICSEEFAMNLKDVDPDNGYFWANLAHYQLENGDETAALQSYKRAVEAPKFDIGWGEQVYRLSKGIDDALAPNGSCSAEIAASASGAAAARMPPFEPFADSCRSRSNNPKWRDACVDLGYKMETEALTLISRMTGIAMQRIVYESQDEVDKLSELAERRSALYAVISHQGDLYQCMWEDPAWVSRWLSYTRDYGEMETMRLMSEQATQFGSCSRD